MYCELVSLFRQDTVTDTEQVVRQDTATDTEQIVHWMPIKHYDTCQLFSFY